MDADNVRLAMQCLTDQSFTSPAPGDFLLDIAHQKNRTPLPLIKPYSGPPDCPQLPPEIPAEEGLLHSRQDHRPSPEHGRHEQQAQHSHFG
ncbi:transcription initiation factor TFIID subunit 9B-like [Zonotrichia albicollis]|uniref:transcription initiation factor TFIID subunit 9B-like n=1 Tax=Zonotrichia albicollis TaxID=44394 RepID=UPI003D80E968